MDDVDRMDGDDFEVSCCWLWGKLAYQASITPKRGGEGGIDVVALKDRKGQLLQCKPSKPAVVGLDSVEEGEVTAGAAPYLAQCARTSFRRVVVKKQGYSTDAVAQAEANRVEVVTRRTLEALTGHHPIANHDFDSALVETLTRVVAA